MEGAAQQNASIVPSQVTLAVDPEELPPPPPGFQWARLDDIMRRSLTGSENDSRDRPNQDDGYSSNEKVHLQAKTAKSRNLLICSFSQAKDDLKLSDRSDLRRSLGSMYNGGDQSELRCICSAFIAFRAPSLMTKAQPLEGGK
jgi:hypothetical protein